MKRTIKGEPGVDIKDLKALIIIDDEGELYHKGAEVEYDFYIETGKTLLFEMKLHPEKNDINNFIIKARSFEKVKKVKPELYLIALSLDKEVIKQAKRAGVKLIGPATKDQK
ncbi:MAG: hypothetical protein GF308_02055 [Candidatus Heimdallarchaeota archaeon]|nr:hypothetical protein [Candidatus Heimdallarchaeota archaeon]